MALKRLNRDYKSYLKDKSFNGICSLYQDLENGLKFHVNLFHEILKVIHFTMIFPQNYPFSPPKINLYGFINHPNIFYDDHNQFPYICLDILQERNEYTPDFSGWSSAYTLSSIIMQFYSFLFDEKIERIMVV